MERIPITPELDKIPTRFHSLFRDAAIFDSSCSHAARVWFLDKGPGFYLKTAAKGSLRKEADMTRFFHSKQLGAEVLAYESLEADWLLTARVPGEDCVHPMYLADPVRLCDTTAELLRQLHSTDPSGCPAANQTADYLAAARHNYEMKAYQAELFPDNWGYASAEEAWHVVEENGKFLKSDTLLHGDYCLPNIILENWRFSGFIDLDTGGIGDRHMDLFWGLWSLRYNLKTDRYRDRFLDAYGRGDVCGELLRVIAAIEVFS